MKRTQLSRIALFSFIMVSGSVFSQRTTTPRNHDTIQCTMAQDGHNKFEVLPLTPSNSSAFFSHLWWSGDNSFSFLAVPEHTHRATSGNSNFPQVKMTDITTENYGNGGPPPLTYDFTTNVGRRPVTNVLSPGTDVYMQNYRNAVLRDTMYLIVTYANWSQQKVTGSLELNVGNYATILDQMFTSHPHFLSNGEQWDANNRQFHFNDLAPKKERSILVPVLISSNAEGKLDMRVDMIRKGTDIKDPISGIDYSTISATVAHSHDPNMMVQHSDADSQCDYRNGKIHYTVKFQNVGEGPTSYVRVECFLDDKVNMSSIDGIVFPDMYAAFNPGTIQEEYVQNAGAIYSIDVANKKVTFEMHDLVLQGTGDVNLKDLELSRDQIEFDILVKNNYVFGPGTLASSTIYFDENEPIETNQVETVCGDQLSPANGGGFQKIKDIKDTQIQDAQEERKVKRKL